MKTRVSPVIVGVVIVAFIGVVASVCYYQSTPKVYGLTPPTAEERHRAADQMRRDMMESMRHRAGQRAPR